MKLKCKYLLIIISLLFSSLFLSCGNSKITNNLDYDGKFIIHFIDVGQGDSTLIQVNNKNMLIDSGSKTSEENLLSYLKALNIDKLDYVIATHPHEDHIGNMDAIIDKFEINKFYAPKVTSNSKSFENMVSSLKNKNKKINIVKEGIDSINLGNGTRVTVFSPKKDFKDDELNNYSPIIKIEFGETSFLLTGDAEEENENYVISKNKNLSSDVLKVGHHGSSSSTSSNFLKKVNPSIAIISCGLNNSYNHPSPKTIKLLEKSKIKVYRTDKNGTIVISSDGKNLFKH